jgi:radical SAM-linked protein
MHRSEKVISMSSDPSKARPDAPASQEKHRLAVRYSIEGDLRFISHHDTMRLWARAMARGRLPVRFSQGMNPQPRMSLPLPRPVGVASQDEWLVVEFTERLEPAELCRRLAEQAPAGLTVHEARRLGPAKSMAPAGVTYRLPLPTKMGCDEGWDARIEECLARDEIPVSRKSDRGRRIKQLDIRPYLQNICVVEGHLEFTLTVGPDGAAKPAEVLQALGLNPLEHLHRLVRTRTTWGGLGQPPTASP